MSLILGSEVKSLYLGGEVKEAWLNGTKVWEKKAEGLVIDGKTYRIGEMPDGRIWMLENVNVEISGCYFINEDYGRLYNPSQALQAESRVIGWHIPSDIEWRNLFNSCGSASDIKKLKSVDFGGTDDYGFSLRGVGIYENRNYYPNCEAQWMKDGQNVYHMFYFTQNSNSVSKYNSILTYSLRLIKNA